MSRAKILAFCISLFLSLLGLLPLAITQATKDVSSAVSVATVEEPRITNAEQNATAPGPPASITQPNAMLSEKTKKQIDLGWLVHFGIAWTVVLGIVTLGIFLSEADKLNEKWTDKADLALKGAGGLVIIVLTYWIGMISENRASEEKAAKDRTEATARNETKRKEDAEKAAEANQNSASRKADETRRKAERAEFVVRNLGEPNETVRLAAIAVAGESLQEDSLYSLTMLQVLFTIVRSNEPADKALRETARDFLPPLQDGSIAKRADAVRAILDSYSNVDELLRTKLQEGGSPAVDRAMLALAAIGRDATAAKIRDEANGLTKKLSSSIALEIAKAPDVSAATLEQLAPSLVLAATTTGPDTSDVKRKEAQKLVSKLPQEVVENAVERLPQTLRSSESPFLVYVHIAHEGQRLLATHFQEELQRKGFVVPGIQGVGGKGFVPEDNEVRRFFDGDKDTLDASNRVLEVLHPLDNDRSRLSYVRPTSDNERKKGRLEVWFSGQYREPAWPGYSGWIVAGHYAEGKWTRTFLDFDSSETPDSLTAKSATPYGLPSSTTGKNFLYLGSTEEDAKKIGGLYSGQDVLIREIKPARTGDIIYARIEVVSKPKQNP
jgi:hypothetical protein